MPMLTIEFNDAVVSSTEVLALSEQFQKIVVAATSIEDVFVYANSAKIMVKAAPLELFIFMTNTKIEDEDELIGTVKTELASWKKEHNFPHRINLTLIPMHWKVEIGI